MLARRLLDDPVVYFSELSPEASAYFLNQRGPLASRLSDAAGLTPEQRAEGVALVDQDGELTDIAMPAEGTDAHATLLVAEHLCSLMASEAMEPVGPAMTVDDAARFIAAARERFGRYWRRSAREPGSEVELAALAVARLEMLHLVRVVEGLIVPMPALSRFSLADAEVVRSGRAREDVSSQQALLPLA